MTITKQQAEQILQLSFTSDTAVEDAQVKLQEIIDQAIAHGMTLSAEIVVENNQPVFDLPTRLHTGQALGQAILTARDNKVWRKE